MMIKTAVIDCRRLTGETAQERKACHSMLVEVLSLPEYYGANLDALHDCLTGLCDETEIILTHFEEARQDAYCEKIVRVLCDCARENKAISLMTASEYPL